MLISAEHGKVVSDASGEVARGLEVVEFACGIPHLLKGGYSEQVSTETDVHSIRQPLGVCAGITPFNFPAMVPMWMWPVAIACGNTFILKPSERDPSASMLVARWLADAGLPDGVLNVVHGDKVAVDALLAHPDVRAVSFVGSTPIARYVYETAAAGGKRVQALGGAKNHMVVLPDADLDVAADAAVSAGYGSAGERCMAISVVVAVGDVADPLVDAIRARTEALVIGPGSDPASEMGPLVTAGHRDRVAGYVDAGVAAGASLVVDGRSREVAEGADGFFFGPCLFDRVTTDMSIYTRRDLRTGALGRPRRHVRGRSTAAVRQPVRERRRDLHPRRRCGPTLRAGGGRRDGRRERPDPGAHGVLLVRGLEAELVRRHARARPRGRALLHAGEGGHESLGRSRDARARPRLSHDVVTPVLQLRIITPDHLTETVLAHLRSEHGATNITVQRGGAVEPLGDVVVVDVVRERGNVVMEQLVALELDALGSISITTLDAVSSERADLAEAAAAGSGLDAIVWEELDDRARSDAGWSITFGVLMAIAAVIAGVGVLVDSPVLIIGAMIVGPEYGPLSALAVGVYRRRRPVASQAATTLVIGLLIAMLAAGAATALFLAVGEVSPNSPRSRFFTAFVTHPNFFSIVVAFVAGIAGTIALTRGRQETLAGVLVSVTTIPAAAAVGVDTVFGEWSDALGGLAQLGINVCSIVLASILTLAIHDRTERRKVRRTTDPTDAHRPPPRSGTWPDER